MGDEYVSVEHLFLSMIQNPNKEIKAIFQEIRHYQRAFPEGFEVRYVVISVLPVITRKLRMILWRSTDRIWWKKPEIRSLIRYRQE